MDPAEDFLLVLVLAVALSGLGVLLFSNVKQDKIDAFLSQRYVWLTFIVVGFLAAVHLIWEFFALSRSVADAFDWDYLFDFIAGEKHDHSIIEEFVALVCLTPGIYGATRPGTIADPLNIREKLK